MNMTVIVTFLVIAFFIAAIGTIVYLYVRDHTLEDIRADVYQLFLQAEHTFIESKAGKQKMKFVIQQARGLLPTWAQTFITDELLKNVIQAWFDAVKDLLDDGKYNGSTNKTS